MKKLISSILCLAMTCALFVPAGAVETVTVTVNAAAASSGDSVFSNRYDYVTVKGTERLSYTEIKTPEQLADEQAILEASADFITGLFSSNPFPETVLDLLLPDASDIIEVFMQEAHGVGKAAKIEVYTRTDVRYRVDSLTGDRVAISSTYVMTFKLYVREGSSYTLYNTKVCSKHN